MKKFTLIPVFFCLIGTAFCQDQPQSYDSSFRALYKAVALHPGRFDPQGIMHDSMVRRWDKDIKVFIEGSTAKDRREILNKLKNTIAVLSPALNNKIHISFTNDRSSANYLINLDFDGRSGWHLKWDRRGNIYSGLVLINTRVLFNYDEQAQLISHYFLLSLGDFVFNEEDKAVFYKPDASLVSNMIAWRQGINNIDLQILKLNYSDDIKPGMARKDIDRFFDSHSH